MNLDFIPEPELEFGSGLVFQCLALFRRQVVPQEVLPAPQPTPPRAALQGAHQHEREEASRHVSTDRPALSCFLPPQLLKVNISALELVRD